MCATKRKTQQNGRKREELNPVWFLSCFLGQILVQRKESPSRWTSSPCYCPASPFFLLQLSLSLSDSSNRQVVIQPYSHRQIPFVEKSR
jgi:hypothetical protein